MVQQTKCRQERGRKITRIPYFALTFFFGTSRPYNHHLLRYILFLVCFACAHAAVGQIKSTQISLFTPMVDSPVIFNRYDNLIRIAGFKKGMDVSFSTCTVEYKGGDTFNIKAKFTGHDTLVVKQKRKILYQKPYRVESFVTANVNLGPSSDTFVTTKELLVRLAPMHRSSERRVRVVFVPRKGDIYEIECIRPCNDNAEAKQLTSLLLSGDRVIIEIPGEGTTHTSRIFTIK